MTETKFKWTSESERLAREMLDREKPIAEIARALGCHHSVVRSFFFPKWGAAEAARKKKKREAEAQARAAKEAAANAPPRAHPLMGLKAGQCRFPWGDPLSPDFGYCGAPRMGAGRPYCAHHMRYAYQPGTARRAPKTEVTYR